MLDVALDSGVSPETVRKIESGRVATPSFPTVAAIARVLGLSLDTLWDEVNVAEGEASAADDSLPGRRLPGDPLRKRSPVTASGADASASRR